MSFLPLAWSTHTSLNIIWISPRPHSPLALGINQLGLMSFRHLPSLSPMQQDQLMMVQINSGFLMRELLDFCTPLLPLNTHLIDHLMSPPPSTCLPLICWFESVHCLLLFPIFVPPSSRFPPPLLTFQLLLLIHLTLHFSLLWNQNAPRYALLLVPCIFVCVCPDIAFAYYWTPFFVASIWILHNEL